ncbi:hypothetical protein YWIDRAFT_00414 [Streptomyces sp. SceaMP-e96]|uniref:hypothetical protein n=1 Tax=Streptomyces TaxID=1883 RepID=UPI000823A217|nr:MULTISPECIES: hypothetical protein [unclassified Streptomyces]MYT11223.1 hypothetical protein [Streptomyces sp. SID4951]SCK07729.1 hypothetical protein YWIDRAFT_00414 [Streptomyces sp. SceaMP-e96]
MPPKCIACTFSATKKHNPSDEFTVVFFRPTVDYPDSWTGHPENAEWFCAEHLPLAEGLTDLSALEAAKQIRAQLTQDKA